MFKIRSTILETSLVSVGSGMNYLTL